MIRIRRARLSAGILLGAAALVTPLLTLSAPASAAPSSPASFHAGSAKLLTQAASPSALKAVTSAFKNEGPRTLAPLHVKGTTMVGAADAAGANGFTLGGTLGLLHNFNGLSDLDQANVNGGEGVGELTPPDQGLCIGNDPTLSGNPKVVFEPINAAVRETTTHGSALRPDFSLATLFDDPFASGDVRCLYDQATQSFYFTEIGFPVSTGPVQPTGDPLPLNTTVDVAVLNSSGVADYQFDTSEAGTCFGDQPKTGFDNNALIVSTDEYCGANETEIGAIAIAISKPQLLAEGATVDDAVSPALSLAGDPIVGLDPAINTGSDTAYFVNSVPFLANGSNNPVGNTLGLWTLTNSADVASDPGAITISGTVLNSEPYAFPVPATSTGNGSTTIVNGETITSETALNPDDSRLSGPVSVTHNFSGTELWTALDAAISPHGDSTARDGAAWFAINVGSQSIARQGYITARGANLLYPAIGAPDFGDPVVVFTITSSKINPSAAYAYLGSNHIITVASGTGAHVSFSDAAPFFSPRWGDYSFAQVDPSGVGVWLATEYIPPAANQDPIDNWGTSVFEVLQGI